MFKNYLLTAFKVYARRKVFTAINLACIVLTLVVVVAACCRTPSSRAAS
jgi:putative ABC transport system permease protein